MKLRDLYNKAVNVTDEGKDSLGPAQHFNYIIKEHRREIELDVAMGGNHYIYFHLRLVFWFASTYFRYNRSNIF